MAGQNVKLSTKATVTPTVSDKLVIVTQTGDVRLAAAQAINGGSYTAQPTSSELAPAAGSGSWTLTGSPAPTQNGSGIHFAAASNLAAASYTGAALKDNQTYDVSVTIANLTGGKAQVMVYGPTTAHLGASAELTANGTYTFQVTTSAAGTVLNTIRIRATGAGGTNTFDVTAISVKEVNSYPYPVRSMTEKAKEAICSLRDFDVDPSGSNDSTSGITRAILECGRRLLLPSGTYRASSLLIDRSIEIVGEGRDFSIIDIFGTGNIHGMRIIGETALGRSNLIRLKNFQLRYVGAGQTAAGSGPGQNNWSGVYVQRKVIAEGLYVKGFTNDGIYFAPSDEAETGVAGTIDEAVFFSRWVDVWSKENGRDGLAVRRGANANNFTMCQWDKNGRYGAHQYTDGFATYGNTHRDGQASYNKQEGYRWANGTNNITSGLYAEHNGTPTNTNTDSYTNTPYDFYIGDNCTKSWFGLGVLYNGDTGKVRVPGFNPSTIQVWEGGRKLFGDT